MNAKDPTHPLSPRVKLKAGADTSAWFRDGNDRALIPDWVGVNHTPGYFATEWGFAHLAIHCLPRDWLEAGRLVEAGVLDPHAVRDIAEALGRDAARAVIQEAIGWRG